jgi:hypothetical protein
MDNGQRLHNTLIPLEDFKALLGIDEREDALARYCLSTATFTIEAYCRRRLVLKRHFERLEYTGDLLVPLGEYPVREVLGVYAVGTFGETGELLEPDLYRVVPNLEAETGTGPEDSSVNGDFSWPHAVPPYSSTRSMFRVHYQAGPEDRVYSLSLSPALNRSRGFTAIKTVYRAGYGYREAPADLASACLELAAWNMSRYRGRRIGMTGAVRGNGKDGEHLESSIPENVRLLLEPYQRRMI